MTITNVTIRQDVAVLSADSWFYSPAHAQQGVPAAVGSKIATSPQVPAAAVVGGSAEMAHGFRNLMAMARGDISELLEKLPGQLRQLHQQLGQQFGAELTFLAGVAGWSERDNRMVGAYLNHADGFEPHPLPEGHSTQPELDPDDREYRTLTGLWHNTDTASIKTLHSKFALNQLRQQSAGTLPADFLMGGQLLLATVDRQGVRLRSAGALMDADRILEHADVEPEFWEKVVQ